MSGYVLKLRYLVAAPTRWTPWNDTYLQAYFPGALSAMQREVGFTSSSDITEARQFATAEDALAMRWQVNPVFPWKTNSQPNYPLAPFVLEAEFTSVDAPAPQVVPAEAEAVQLQA